MAKKCAGFRPQGQVRQPGADASPNRGNPPSREARGRRIVPKKGLYSSAFHKKEDPGAKRPGSIAGWVRGWGAGGHATRRRVSNTGEGVSFRSSQKLFSDSPPHAPSAPRARPCRPTNRQVHMPAVGKFQIARLDAKAARQGAAAFDHVARADGKSAGEMVYSRMHETSSDD